MNAQQIQQKIDEASSSGGRVVIPEGTHVISNPIKLRSNVLIEGQSRRAVIEVAEGKRINLFETDDGATEITNVWICGLEFRGSPNYPHPPTSQVGRLHTQGRFLYSFLPCKCV